MKTEKPFRIAVLISGGGTTLKNLIEYQNRSELDASIKLVVSSSAKAGGLRFAQDAGIPAVVIPKEGESPEESASFSAAIFQSMDDHNIDLVVMGGFLKHLLIPDNYLNKTINIHPSLIPAFSGKGFYGDRVHRSVIEYGCKISGCTVHFVDNQFDHGPIIAQIPVPVETSDSASILQKRIFEAECKILPWVINQFANDSVQVNDRSITVMNHPF